MAFLDSEQDELVLEDEPPERPRRRVGGPQRRRQQFLVRRLIGVGVGLAFLILIVIAFRGCLEARSDRGLRNYDSDVATIMQQSEQSGRDFFNLLNRTGGTSSSLDAQQEVLRQRDTSQTLLDRADDIDAPGQMDDAQNAVIQTLTLRRDALSSIAESVPQATARTQTGNAITAITNAMGSLYASDVLWTQIAKPEIENVLEDEGVDATPLPNGRFMPANATDFLNQTTLVTKLNALTGQTATTGGVHGLQLDSTTIGGQTLTPDSTNTVPADAQEIDIQLTNSGDSDETGITVTVTLGGNELTGQLQALSAGEQGTVTIPLTTKPTPGTDTTLEVVVNPVAGEQITTNNTSTYTVVFGS
ncbi:MAG TPA: CARDB domain-containing protein [Solirubrobacterales bacterium]|nr:CARDB domain-containing protein [Solirubrobacterales bacterium]